MLYFQDYTMQQYYEPLYYPSNALTCIKCMVIINITYIKTAPTCFGSRGNNPQGANVSTWLKLQIWFDDSCPYKCGKYYGGIRRHNTDHIRMDKHRRTIFVILARY